MLIAIISDSHDNIPNIQKALSIINERGISVLIHCGDITTEESLALIRKGFFGDLYLATGNADISPENIKTQASSPEANPPSAEKNKKTHWRGTAGKEVIDGVIIGFTHYPWLAKKLAESGGYDIIFHGHTHTPWEETINGTRILNPGTLAGMFTRPTFAIYDTTTRKAQLELL